MCFDGQRLADLRNDKGLKQAELAEILGVAKRNISLYENNDSIPRDPVKVKIALYFDVSLDYLMGLDDSPIPYNKSKMIRLPKDYPPEAMAELKDYAKYLHIKYSSKDKK